MEGKILLFASRSKNIWRKTAEEMATVINVVKFPPSPSPHLPLKKNFNLSFHLVGKTQFYSAFKGPSRRFFAFFTPIHNSLISRHKRSFGALGRQKKESFSLLTVWKPSLLLPYQRELLLPIKTFWRGRNRLGDSFIRVSSAKHKTKSKVNWVRFEIWDFCGD